MIGFIPNRKVGYIISSVLVALSIVSMAAWGLRLGIDFTGGSFMEVQYAVERPEPDAIREALAQFDPGDISVQPVGDKSYNLRFADVDETTHQAILGQLKTLGEEGPITQIVPVPEAVRPKLIGVSDSGEEMELTGANIVTETTITAVLAENKFDSIGPIIGQELKRKSLYTIMLVLIAIILYVTWAFRRVSKPVQSWKYGIIAVIALFHDIIILLGVYSVIGHFFVIDVNTPFVAAVLTILGYSVNDTIVIFDRVRENLIKKDREFADTINASVNQTVWRSVNTSVTTLFVLLAILFFGGETTRYFVLALAIGVVLGTYSSIFLASPLLVSWHGRKRKPS